MRRILAAVFIIVMVLSFSSVCAGHYTGKEFPSDKQLRAVVGNIESIGKHKNADGSYTLYYYLYRGGVRSLMQANLVRLDNGIWIINYAESSGGNLKIIE